jgi:hypothetical protein
VFRATALAPPRPDSGSISTPGPAPASSQPIGSPTPSKLDLPGPTAEDVMLMDESDRASAASTMDLAASLVRVAFTYGLFGDQCPPRPQEQGAEIQDDGPTAEADTHKRDLASWHRSCPPGGRLTHHSNARTLRCTRSRMRNLGRSRWLNGPCWCLHHGCTNGTGPRPTVEP